MLCVRRPMFLARGLMVAVAACGERVVVWARARSAAHVRRVVRRRVKRLEFIRKVRHRHEGISNLGLWRSKPTAARRVSSLQVSRARVQLPRWCLASRIGAHACNTLQALGVAKFTHRRISHRPPADFPRALANGSTQWVGASSHADSPGKNKSCQPRRVERGMPPAAPPSRAVC